MRSDCLGQAVRNAIADMVGQHRSVAFASERDCHGNRLNRGAVSGEKNCQSRPLWNTVAATEGKARPQGAPGLRQCWSALSIGNRRFVVQCSALCVVRYIRRSVEN